MERKVGITTIDNPFDYFEDFNNWFLFDIEKGYYTCNKIARLSKTFEGMSEKEEIEEVERAIDRLVEIDPLDIYKKIYKKHKENKSKDINKGTISDD